MPKYRFSLTRIFPYKDRIYDSLFIWESTGQRESAFSHIVRSRSLHIWTNLRDLQALVLQIDTSKFE